MSQAEIPNRILFTDLRHIQCGTLSWATPDGRRFGVSHPPAPQVEMHAQPRHVPHGVRLAAQPARKTEPMAEWRGWGRIVHDQGRYRSWYLMVDGHALQGSGSRSQTESPGTVEVVSVESEDGFAWREGNRCPISVPGQKSFDGLTFFVDPIAPPAERYKLVYCAQPPDAVGNALLAEYMKRPARHRDVRIGERRKPCFFAATSPDGVRWKAVERPLMVHHGDTDNTFYYDASIERYVLYTRMFRQDRRWVGRAESEDFRDWGPVEPILWPRLDDPLDQDIYLNGYTTYPGLPDWRLMFPMFYHRSTERSDVRLYASEDGIVWNQVPGGPVITPGESGAWDSEFIAGGKDLVPLGEGRVAIPYMGTPYPHKYPRWPEVFRAWRMGWAWWPEGRLCAVQADGDGVFWTAPLLPTGRGLRLNFRTPRGGEMRVGLEGVAGRSVDDCDPMHGDDPARKVTWRGQADIGAAEGQEVVLHFQMRCADLFGVEWV
ncbi:MAG: hypothetical protein EXS64_00710 [Candidatus Latescibacteria bacterium]|nr:hypothetical protein [Candidatus Latescibacterota bacterium]